jgi:uncharacterized membrane protein
MISNIDEYLNQLKIELAGCDRATIQDALADAEEYLRSALEQAKMNGQPAESEALSSLIDEYGSPAEIAAAYKRIEARIPFYASSRSPRKHLVSRFFGVLGEPRAWGALFYLFLSLVTGIFYFTWVITGLTLSLSLLILIIGIPIAGLFLLSTRGIALIEGRLVEALLGMRMPHRQLFSKYSSLWSKLKTLISDKDTWTAMLYLILQLPLGVFYFSLFITLFSVSIYSIARPILELGLGAPLFVASGIPYFTPGWLMPLVCIGGVVLFVLTLHLAKIIGRLHGVMAKTMLVRK